jgi:hypothetical protein
MVKIRAAARNCFAKEKKNCGKLEKKNSGGKNLSKVEVRVS